MWPPLWSSGQSSWLQIRRPVFDSRNYQKKKVVGLERGPLSLVSTTEELLDRKSSSSCLESREYGRRDPSCWPRGTLYLQKLAITSPTSGGRSFGIVRLWTQRMEFFFVTNIEQILKYEWTSDSPVDLGNYWEDVGGTIFTIIEEVSSSDLMMRKFHKITYLTKWQKCQ
jgi:hypothetical protein